jgi:hypothetical protein
MNKDRNDVSMIYDRDNIVLFAVLKYLSNPDICFNVANAHLLYNTKRGDIKLGQTYQLTNALMKIKQFYSKYFNLIQAV